MTTLIPSMTEASTDFANALVRIRRLEDVVERVDGGTDRLVVYNAGVLGTPLPPIFRGC